MTPFIIPRPSRLYNGKRILPGLQHAFRPIALAAVEPAGEGGRYLSKSYLIFL